MKTILALLACAGLLILAANISLAKPDKAPPAKKKMPSPTPTIPSIACETPWGTMGQAGRKVLVTGDTWRGEGAIRDDGKLEVLWTLLLDGKRAIGVYNISADGLDVQGRWGWGDEVNMDKGELCGQTMPETLRQRPEMPPAF